jgi:Holliday junction resolvase
MGEETITELLLLELKRRHENEIKIVPFNRRQEARNGADWAWSFEGKQWLGMRVQA